MVPRVIAAVTPEQVRRLRKVTDQMRDDAKRGNYSTAADREAYLRRRGRAAAERILKMGLYSHLDAAMRAAERAPDRWVEQVGRVMTTLSPAMFSFSRWEFVAGDAVRLFSLNVHEAGDIPEDTRVLLQGFIEALFVPFTDDRVQVTSRRPSPDLIVYEGARLTGSRAD